jgi:hypothetical protein
MIPNNADIKEFSAGAKAGAWNTSFTNHRHQRLGGVRAARAFPRPGNRFISFVHAHGVHCLVGKSLKSRAAHFTFSLFGDGLSLFP